ncbi:hypothetical protein OHB26_16300 [Nocardia sp. NBC_01503]|uniref:hypothetical protein n=1 Tax=Nocardia sp. NBC_01503 TaxID=2975997 RepID=UPI002E7AD02E|nr:hypothetical protein [Nocardia sp. NBC_01503]WTL35612.1 hypothetical protein OHB26_16300 [Nocardia sp. NBC_01503]
MTATTLTALKAAQRSLLLKPLDAAVFLAPYGTQAPLGGFTDAAGNLQALPAAFQSIGLIDKKTGIAFSRGITAAPIESYGELQAVRNDITSDITTLEFEPQQNATALNLQLTTSAALSAMTPSSTNGEVWFAQPSAENITYYSAIVIGKDGNDALPTYVIKVLPKVAVSKFGGEQWVPTGVLSNKLTMVAFKDDVAGFAVAHSYAGAGWQKLVAASGMPYLVSALNVAPAGAQTLTMGSNQALQLVVTDQFGGVIAPNMLTFTKGTGLTTSVNISSTGVVTPTSTTGSGVIDISFTAPAGWPASTATTATGTISVA